MTNETKSTLKTQHVNRMRQQGDDTPKPKHVIRTSCSNYFFGAGKAAVSNPNTKKRQPSKLPTTLSELPEKVKAPPRKE